MYHPFDGDRILHAIRFAGGRATYRNRLIRTVGPACRGLPMASLRGWGAMRTTKDSAGVGAVAHAGKPVASMPQCGEPYHLDVVPLATKGVHTWGKLIESFGLCSHFNLDTATGELMFCTFGETRETMRNDGVSEFPPVANDSVGEPYRCSVNTLFKPGSRQMSGVKRFDLQAGGYQRFECTDNRYDSKPCIALPPGATEEDDGDLLTFHTDMNTSTFRGAEP